MGFWKSKRGTCGDSWADTLDDCMHKLSRLKMRHIDTPLQNVGIDDNNGDHEINMAEFADLVEFCSRGHIIAELNYLKDGEGPLSKLHSKGIETYSNRGQIHCK